jgi:UDP-N-acetylmuramoyl-L-alanyl-D-glutamate--2,6-diaminopimelate ligase
MALTLGELCAPWPSLTIEGPADVPVSGVVEDSRQVGPGTVFVAVTGHGADGHAYVTAAIAAGAAAVVVERARLDAIRAALPPNCPATWVVASSTRGLPARLAREWEGRPDTTLTMAGVTGTNGKTTTSYLLQSLLARLHGPAGLLGTIRYDDGRVQETAPLTTPGGPLLFAWLGRMARAGCRAAAMEISSHALDQDRTGELALDVAVLTNLGRDHLDYHGDLMAYLAAKARILDLLDTGPRRGKPPGAAVINVGDAALAPLAAGREHVVRFAAVADPVVRADLRVLGAELSLRGTDLTLDWRGRRLALRSKLVGRFNVENLTAALAAGLALGYDPDACSAALAAVAQVPGRLERFLLPAGGLAVVDYAHTHDALAAVLLACRELGARRLLVVFGCGGDRDRGKRALMGQVAAELADLAWITSDNPRSEDPAAICAMIAAGFEAAAQPRARGREIILDRRTAIAAALAVAGHDDVVVVAGKGHEDYQLVQGQVLELDDRQVIREWIARKERDA